MVLPEACAWILSLRMRRHVIISPPSQQLEHTDPISLKIILLLFFARHGNKGGVPAWDMRGGARTRWPGRTGTGPACASPSPAGKHVKKCDTHAQSSNQRREAGKIIAGILTRTAKTRNTQPLGECIETFAPDVPTESLSPFSSYARFHVGNVTGGSHHTPCKTRNAGVRCGDLTAI